MQVGALLIFDEVQCGMGRVGQPFAANLYGVQPDMITTAKALGEGFPCAALLMSPRVSAAVKLDALGTTFGGGPMACAVIEAVIEAIESEHLLEHVRRVAALIRKTLHGRPGDRPSGRGPADRPAHQRGRPRRFSASCWSATSWPAPAPIRTSCGCCRRSCCEAEHVDLLRDALLDIGA